MEVPPHVKVGHRISLFNDRGTIRYIGPVQDTKGSWLGVEWDDPSRGKHDGVSGNRRYFHCRQAGDAGSFIRYSPKLDFGTSFLKALSSKYLPPQTPFLSSEEQNPKPKYSRKNLAEIEIETPNFDGVIKRAARLSKLREAGLGGWKQAEHPEKGIKKHQSVDSEKSVALAFEEGERKGDIEKTCPSILWLELSRSLIPSWDEVASICVELEKLESLLLQFNRFERVTSQIPETWCSSFLKVKDLRLDGTLIDWTEAMYLEKAFPSLELLQLGHNNLRKLGSSPAPIDSDSRRNGRETPALRNLKILNLEGNLLSDWEDLAQQLSSIPHLQRLILSSNQFKSIHEPSKELLSSLQESGTVPFVSLEHISLLENPIESWSDLEALDSWLKVGRQASDSAAESTSSTVSNFNSKPGLKSLTIGGEECRFGNDLQARDFRLNVIARLGALQSFNGGLIRPMERKDSELFYLSQVAAENLSEERLKELHPRFEELSIIYGAPEAPQRPDKAAGTLRNKLIELKVYSRNLSDLSAESSKAQLPLDQTLLKTRLLFTTPIRLVKAKVAKTLNLKPQSIKKMLIFLDVRSGGKEGEEEVKSEMISFELEDERKDLNWYEAKDGDSILVLN